VIALVSLFLLGYLAGLGSYWVYVIAEWHLGKRRRSWSA
jgi:hypothetical protein